MRIGNLRDRPRDRVEQRHPVARRRAGRYPCSDQGFFSSSPVIERFDRAVKDSRARSSMIDTIQAYCLALARLSIRTQLGGFAVDGHTNSRNSVSTKPIDAASAVFRSRISETKRLGRFRVAAFRVSHSCMREPPSEPSGSASTALTTSR
jgi:hypothetical protein